MIGSQRHPPHGLRASVRWPTVTGLAVLGVTVFRLTVFRMILLRVIMLGMAVAGAALAEEAARPEAVPTATAPAERPVAGVDSREAYLVQQAERARWLGDGPDRFAIIETPAAWAQARGTVLIMTDAGESAGQGVAGQLHRALPRRGWNLVSVALPRLPLPVYPDRASTAPTESGAGGEAVPKIPKSRDAGSQAGPARDDSTVSAVTIDLAAGTPGKAALQGFEARSSARLEAALAHLVQQPGPLVIVGIGLGAAPVTQLIAGGQGGGLAGPEGQQAMVWIQPRFQSYYTRSGAIPAELTTLAGWPVLDVVDRADYDPAQVERKVAMQKLEGSQGYRQDLVRLAEGPGEAGLAYRIHNWAARQFDW